MKLWEKQSIFTQNVAKLLQAMKDRGFNPTLGECYRTTEQAALNAKDGKGIAHSLHCERLAVDINLLDKDGNYLTDNYSYKIFSGIWKEMHPYNKWGGDFVPLVDSNHFQMNNE